MVGTGRSGWGGERPGGLEPPRMKVLELPPPGPLWNSKRRPVLDYEGK